MQIIEVCESHTRRGDGTSWFSFIHIRTSDERWAFVLQRSPERPLIVERRPSGFVDVVADAGGVRFCFHRTGTLIADPFHLKTTLEERDILLRVFEGELTLPEDGRWVTLADLAAYYAPAPIDDGEPAEGDVVRHVA